MKLLMYGVNKETVTKEEANKYKLSNGRKERQMTEILDLEGIEEIIILDSDFRNEYYLYVDELTFSHGQFLRYLSNETGKNLEEVIRETYSKFNEDVLRHLYEIANGYLSNPQGDFGILISLENSLSVANYLRTTGRMLKKLFEEAIQLAYSLKLEETVRPLNLSQISKYIYSLEDKLGQLKNKNYILAVKDPRLAILSKVLFLAEAQTVTITHNNDDELEKKYEEIREDLTEKEKNKFYMADSNTLNYRLSKADAVILNLNSVDILDQENREDIAEIRQTRKIQYVIDTSENPLRELKCNNLDIELIDLDKNYDYSDDEQQEAVIEFEDILTSHISRFMIYFRKMNKKDLTELSC